MKNSKTEQTQTLLIGIGNTGRADDGLGWLFLNRIKQLYPDRFEFEYRYQLQVEDAELISNFDTVLFIDATVDDLPDGIALKVCEPATEYFYSSHMQSPEAILYLAKTLYNKQPETSVLKITGYEWGLGKPLSSPARQNLDCAADLFRKNYILQEEPSY